MESDFWRNSLSREMRFLLVEDNAVLAEGLSWALRDLGHEVSVVAMGRQAIGMIQHQSPDAVILDISLPDIDGVQVAEFIRRDHPDLPIVFASGHDGDQPRLIAAVKDSATAILRKPYATETLLEVVSKLIAERRRQRGGAP